MRIGVRCRPSPRHGKIWTIRETSFLNERRISVASARKARKECGRNVRLLLTLGWRESFARRDDNPQKPLQVLFAAFPRWAAPRQRRSQSAFQDRCLRPGPDVRYEGSGPGEVLRSRSEE